MHRFSVVIGSAVVNQGEQLKRGPLRMFLAALPLTDHAGCDVEVACKDRLGDPCSLFEGSDLSGRKLFETR